MQKLKYTVLIVLFGLTVTFFAAAQNSKDQKKNPPETQVYVVQKGDTLYGISRKFEITLDELCRLNDFTKEYNLKAGQKIFVPVKNADKENVKNEEKTPGNQKKSEENKKSENKASDKKEDVKSAEKNAGKASDKKNNEKASEKASESKKENVKNVQADKKAETVKETKTPEKAKNEKNQNNQKEIKADKTEKTSAARKYDTYTVQKGDTFWGIAKKNGIETEELKKLNNLTSKSMLKVGQKLKIPVTIVDIEKSNKELPDLSSADPRKYDKKSGDSTLVWPVKNPKVTYITGKVSGVQLSAQKKESVKAIRAGTVSSIGNYRGYGPTVFIQTKTGQVYAYSGLEKINVEKGQYVVFEDIIGTAGTDTITGNSQILLMVFQKGQPIDPAKAPRG